MCSIGFDTWASPFSKEVCYHNTSKTIVVAADMHRMYSFLQEVIAMQEVPVQPFVSCVVGRKFIDII